MSAPDPSWDTYLSPVFRRVSTFDACFFECFGLAALVSLSLSFLSLTVIVATIGRFLHLPNRGFRGAP